MTLVPAVLQAPLAVLINDVSGVVRISDNGYHPPPGSPSPDCHHVLEDHSAHPFWLCPFDSAFWSSLKPRQSRKGTRTPIGASPSPNVDWSLAIASRPRSTFSGSGSLGPSHSIWGFISQERKSVSYRRKAWPRHPPAPAISLPLWLDEREWERGPMLPNVYVNIHALLVR